MRIVNKEFIFQLLSKIEDTSENRNLLERLVHNIHSAQNKTEQQQTVKVVVEKQSLQTDLDKTIIIPPQSIQTLPTNTGTSVQQTSENFFHFERYEDIELLGKGGMGEVRKVRDRYLNRFVAMKIVQSNVLLSTDGLNRFIEEARVNAQLQHPNIVPVHDIGVLDDGRYYFTMKEIKGKELSDVISDVHQHVSNAPTLYQLMTIFHTVVDTIAFAHSHGVLHRDLKPSNILIGDFGEVLVLDWGIAKFIHSMANDTSNLISTKQSSTLYGSVTGTPIYMSPEQALGGLDLDERSDIYSLGAILYEILSGTPPYMGDSAEEILSKVRNKKPPPLESFLDSSLQTSGRLHGTKRPYHIPQELIDICNLSMCRDKEKRYSKAKDLAASIQHWLMGLQKRRKAEEAFGKAQAIIQKIEAKKRENVQREKQCAQYFTSKITLEDAWKIWSKYCEEKIHMEGLWATYKENLEHTLFHDPNYQPAHIRILQVLHEEHHTASQRKDTHALNRIVNQYKKCKSRITDHTQIPQQYSSIIESKIPIQPMIGRRKEKDEIIFALKKETKVIGIIGYVGIGKKLFARHIQRTYQHKQRTIWCSVHTLKSREEFWQRLGLSLGLRVQSNSPIQTISAYLNTQKTILILSDIDNYSQRVELDIQELLVHTDTLTVIYTSIQTLDIPQEYVLRLSPLSTFESLSFFQQKAQEILPQFTVLTSNRKIILSICTHLGGIPLAIEIATTHLRSLSVDDLYQKMMKYDLHQTQQYQIIQQAFSLSWDRLTIAAQCICIQMLIFPDDASSEAIEHILLSTEDFIFDVLEQLVHHNLLYTNSDTEIERYGVLPSMRSFVVEKAKAGILSKQEKQKILYKHAQYYAGKISQKNLAYLEVQDQLNDNMRLELSNLIFAAKQGFSKYSAQCAYAAGVMLRMSGTLQNSNDVIDYGLQHTDIPKELFWALTIKKARNFRLLGQFEDAEQILSTEIIPKNNKKDQKSVTSGPFWEIESRYSIFEQLQFLEAYRRMELGSIEYNRGNYDRSEAFYSSSMERFYSIHSQRGVSLIQNGLGNIYSTKGDLDKALHMYKEATKLAQECHFLKHAAICLSQQANILRSQGDFEQALINYKEAIAIQKKINKINSSTVGNLALLYAKMNNREKAIELYKECIHICIEEGNQKFEGINRGNLAAELYAMEAYEESIDMLEQAISICARVLPVAEVLFRGSLALAYIKVDRLSQAELLMDKDYEFLKKIPYEYIKYLCMKVHVFLELKQYQKAETLYNQLNEHISKHKNIFHEELKQQYEKIQEKVRSVLPKNKFLQE